MSQRISQLQDFLKEDENDAFTRFALAMEYQKNGELEKARAFFEYLLDNQSDYLGTYYHAGKLYEILGEKQQAIKTYKEGIAKSQQAADNHTATELMQALEDIDL